MIPQKTLIIAEAGVNHNGNLDTALRLVDCAASAGADYVKFQTFQTENLVAEDSPTAAYQHRHTGEMSQAEMLRKLELSPEAHQRIIAECAGRGIGFLSTPFDLDSFDLLQRLGLELWKIPSGEITNLPLLRRIGKQGQRVILSTGMSEMHEIQDALSILTQSGTHRNNITLLHCTTEYPAPIAEVNLCAMNTMAQTFQTKVGYSDHTAGIEIALAAVAMGACVIEKHFTLDKTMTGPDHAASLEPQELHALVQGIRNIELALGDGKKTASPSEIPNRVVARKSIVASRDIFCGDIFTENNLTTKRPGSGISPMMWEKLCGKPSKQSYRMGERIEHVEIRV